MNFDNTQGAASASAESEAQDLTDTAMRLSVKSHAYRDQQAQLRNATILMVDDEPINLEVIQAFLEDEGYKNFVTTEDSTQALELAAKVQPDVVLLDLIMPKVNGFDILTAMRASEEFQHTPVIILTSATDADAKLEALELGATDFLGKPVDPSELALRLRNTLAAKAYQDQLAYTDALTGLPNRKLLLQTMGTTLRETREAGHPASALHIGLDRFKEINDTLGLKGGDALLKAVAQRLAGEVSLDDVIVAPEGENLWSRTVARLSGDEFALFLPALHRVDDAAIVARRVRRAMSQPFEIEGKEVIVTCTIGISTFPEDGDEAAVLLKHAGMAAHHAKQRGGNTYRFYSKEINARSNERMSLESELRKALDNEELVLYYQPKIDTTTGLMTGAEALIRWEHPRHGLVPPMKFIPIAEDTGLIVPIGEWVFQMACRQARQWQQEGFGNVPIAINVSPKQVRRHQLIETIRKALEGAELESKWLTVELTESAVMDNARQNILILHEMKEMGLKLSIDDFGTGYSSLSYLKRFPLNELKIDRSFLRDLSSDSDDAAIVSAIIALAKNLNLHVVAEGVENREQLAFLKDKGCEQCQGYLFSKPLPAKEFSQRLGGDHRHATDS
jgi:diguanylate cyclase (GGDEF)-like protein